MHCSDILNLKLKESKKIITSTNLQTTIKLKNKQIMQKTDGIMIAWFNSQTGTIYLKTCGLY